MNGDPGPVLELLPLPCNRRDQSENVEHVGPQFGGDSSDDVDGRVRQPLGDLEMRDSRARGQRGGEN